MKKNPTYKKNPIIAIIKRSLISLPTPFYISFIWNIGFILGITLLIQIITGLVLSINYVASVEEAFSSVIHIIRDIDRGWAIRLIHINGASIFFLLLYVHIGRGVFYNSPQKLPLVWLSGIVLLLLRIATAFVGYVLPWGQISFWGATVITSIISAIPYVGKEITKWLWGNFSVSQPTLNRFFSFHFILPLVIATAAMVHLIILHEKGSSNPLSINPDYDKIKFFPYFATKDTLTAVFLIILIIIIMTHYPNILGDVENYNKARISTTPPHIQPEWYFLFAYAILRSIPSKLGGVTAITMSILIFIILTLKKRKHNRKFSPKIKITRVLILCLIIMLTWVGANPVERPYTSMGAFITTSYFIMFLLIYSCSLKEHKIFILKEKENKTNNNYFISYYIYFIPLMDHPMSHNRN